MPDDLERVQVSRADIARLTGVQRPAVTNWERRHPDFPAPADSGSGFDRFVAAEVAAWLDRRKVPAKAMRSDEPLGTTFGDRFRAGLGLTVPPPSAESVADALAAVWTDRFGMADERAVLLLALVFAWAQAPQARDSAADLRAVMGDALGEELGHEVELRDLVQVMSRQGMDTPARCAEVFDVLLARFRTGYRGKSAGGLFTPISVARTLARLVAADGKGPATLYDPYCRSGEVLSAAVNEARRCGSAPWVLGETPDREAIRLARMNLGVRGVRAELAEELALEPGHAGPGRHGGADWIVTNPPFSQKLSAHQRERAWRYDAPAAANGDLGWLQYVVDSIAPGGRAAVVMPIGAGFRGGADGRIRKAMIEDGAIECVVALPPGLFADTGIPVSVWVLRKPSGQPEDVLLIDGSALGHRASANQRELSEGEITSIVDAFARQHTGSPNFSRVVSVEELRLWDHILQPSRYLSPDASALSGGANAEALAARVAGLDSAAAELLERVGRLARTSGPSVSRVSPLETAVPPGQLPPGWIETTLGELAEVTAGRHYAHGGAEVEDGVPLVRPAAISGGRVSTAVATEIRVPESDVRGAFRERLRGGDILMTRTGTIGRCALITPAEEGWVFGNVLRVRPRDAVLSGYLLAFLESRGAQERIRQWSTGSVISSISTRHVRELPVPLPPLQEQQHIGETLANLDAEGRAYAAVADALVQYRRELADLLLSGRFSPPAP